MNYPLLNAHHRHFEATGDLEQAFSLLCLLEKTDEDEITAMFSKIIDYQRPGIRPLGSLIGMIREKIENAMSCLELADSTEDPRVLFKHIFNKINFTNEGFEAPYCIYVGENIIKRSLKDAEYQMSKHERKIRDIKDDINDFIAECCVLESRAKENLFKLYKRFKAWHEMHLSTNVISKNEFCNRLAERFNKVDANKDQLTFWGLKLAPDMDVNPADPENQEFNEDEKELTA